MKKIVYITAQSPVMSIETFILTEMLSLRNLGVELIIVPRDKSNKYFHKEAHPLLENIINTSWFNVRIAKEFLKYIYNNSQSFFEIIHDIALSARNPKIALKNLLILPKALYLSTVLKQQSIHHIHAHRGSTPSTMAYIISKIIGIPWSFTLHRFDIYENNILGKKVESASFVRCISEKGRSDLFGMIGHEFSSKVTTVHMGVEVPHRHEAVAHSASNNENNIKKMCTFSIAANLVPVKGHMYLLEACNILIQRGFKFKCIICGDGPLKDKLKSYVIKNSLSEYIDFYGIIPHERLISMYKERIVDILILPSINTGNGEFEGIPVSLMEAMAFGIPVISTDTGGIPELIGDGSGIMVKEKDPEAIAVSIEKLMNDKPYYDFISERGRKKIERDFNVSIISKELLKLFLQYSKN